MIQSVHLPTKEDHGLRPRGHFGNAAVCGVFKPGPEDAAATTSHFDLSLYMYTQYATFRDEEGVWYNAQRVLEGEMAAAAFVVRAGKKDTIEEAARTHEGMCRWSVKDGEHVTIGAKQHVPAEPGGRNSEPLRLVQSADAVDWDEGSLLHLKGPMVAAFQWYVPMPDGGTLFTAHPHRVSGTFLGKPVEGFMFNDQIYLPRGVTYAMSPFWSDVHIALVSGGTEYEDGTVEAFQIGLGRDRFAFACIADRSGVIHQTSNVKGVMDRDERGFPTHIRWDIDGDPWEWIPDTGADLLGLSHDEDEESYVPAYRASEGRVRRVGDTRKAVAWMGYVETFSARG